MSEKNEDKLNFFAQAEKLLKKPEESTVDKNQSYSIPKLSELKGKPKRKGTIRKKAKQTSEISKADKKPPVIVKKKIPKRKGKVEEKEKIFLTPDDTHNSSNLENEDFNEPYIILSNSLNNNLEEEKKNFSKIDINKLKDKYNQSKEKNKKEKQKRKESSKCKKINWKKLDQEQEPIISFTPDIQQRSEYLKILDSPKNTLSKKRLCNQLSAEFVRIYSSYRKMIQEVNGNVRSYMVPTEEKKYAIKAAEWCIRKGVTPRQVIEYWHNNISNFADGRMKVPPLHFLSSPANIETVVCSVLVVGSRQKRKVEAHSFSDVEELDPRLRSGLRAAGHAVDKFSDRYLLTIQKTAQSIANGISIFIGGDMRPLVLWAAENLYKK